MTDLKLPQGQNRSPTRELSSNGASGQFTESQSAPTTAGAHRGNRRSQRVHIRIGVLVYGQSGSEPFQEATHTEVVNAQGALIRLSARVCMGQKLVLTHERNLEERTCRVVYLGAIEDGELSVGIEFEQPAPHFWQISFPPDDWDPSERKLPSAPRR